MQRKRKLATTLGTALIVAAALPLGSQVDAADHRDAPGTNGTMGGDRFADLNDLYAWHTEDGNIVMVLTFNGLHAADAPVTDYLDPAETPNVLHSIHIDNTADPVVAAMWDDNTNDNVSDLDIHLKLGQNGLEDWGFQIEGIPGASGPIVGPLGETVTDGGVSATVGLFDDPFFFDLGGFQATVANLDEPDDPADLGFALGATVDTFAGTNTMALVIEFPAADAIGDNAENFIQVWATSGRAP
jgi:Domain of unknown function (DUF4331)